MHLQKQVRIPERSIQTSDAWAWQRLHRQIFWLADGRRDAQRIAQLLHKPLISIEGVIVELQQAGYISLRSERKVVVMNVQLLKESFDMIVPQKDAFAHSFYERLFTDYPQTQPLFAQTDMRRQEGALMATLAAVIAGVERGENLVATLQQLGQKHKRYGAKAEDYPLVGAALLETFQHYLGSRFTPEMQDAWAEAYEIISTQMQEGAKTASAQG
jgi:hemoglobin-like flavoprotein